MSVPQRKKARTGLFSVSKFADTEAEQALSEDEGFDEDDYADEMSLAQREQIAITRREEAGRRRERLDDVTSRWERIGQLEQEMEASQLARAASSSRASGGRSSMVSEDSRSAVDRGGMKEALKRKRREVKKDIAEEKARERERQEQLKKLAQRKKERDASRLKDRQRMLELQRAELKQRESDRLNEEMRDEELRRKLENEMKQTKRNELELQSMDSSVEIAGRSRRGLPAIGSVLSDVSKALPSVEDSCLFVIPCVQGKERSVVLEIYSRYQRYMDNPKKRLFIHSAFTTDQNTGHIYIEADREHHVKMACEGIVGLNRWKTKLVPRSEMVQTLTIRTSAPQIRRGQWARVDRPNLYKNDLCQIWDVIDHGNKVVVKIEPRLDYTAIGASNRRLESLEEELTEARRKLVMVGRSHGDSEHKSNEQMEVDAVMAKIRDEKRKFNQCLRGVQSGARPDQKIFNQIEVEQLTGIRPERRKLNKGVCPMCWYFKGKYFRKGYLLLTLVTRNLNFEIQATAQEIARLKQKVGGSGGGSGKDGNSGDLGSGASSGGSGDSTGSGGSSSNGMVDLSMDVHSNEFDREMDNAPAPILETSGENGNFARGDHVRVMEGPLRGMSGSVLSLSKDRKRCRIVPDNEDVRKQHAYLDVATSSLRKEFKIGNKVRILSGPHKDEIGDIVAFNRSSLSLSSAPKLVVLSSSAAQQIIVDSENVSLVPHGTVVSLSSTGPGGTSAAGGSGRNRFGYELYDLVSLTQDSAGVIVGSKNGMLDVLDNHGVKRLVTQQSILKNLTYSTRQALALDIDQVAIRRGDKVIPQTGSFTDQSCTVRHIYKGTVFCYSEQCLMNGHIFVCRTRLVKRAGSSLMKAHGTAQARSGAHHGRPGITQGTGDDQLKDLLPQRARNRNTRKDPWLMKTVMIRKGSYKGMNGIVKKATDTALRIELSAKAKIVTVKRSDVRLLNADGSQVKCSDDYDDSTALSSNRAPLGRRGRRSGSGLSSSSSSLIGSSHGIGYSGMSNGMSTPAYQASTYAARTPAYGGMTPAYGGMTPAYGGMTPAYGGSTPAYGYGEYDQNTAVPGDVNDGSAEREVGKFAHLIDGAVVSVQGREAEIISKDESSQYVRVKFADSSDPHQTSEVHFEEVKRAELKEGDNVMCLGGELQGIEATVQAFDWPHTLVIGRNGEQAQKLHCYFVKFRLR